MLREEYLDFFGGVEDEDGITDKQDKRGRGRPRPRTPQPEPVRQPGKYDALLSRLEPIRKDPEVSADDLGRVMSVAPTPRGTGSTAIQMTPRAPDGAEPHTAEFVRNKIDASIARSPDVETSRKKRSFWDRLGGGLWNAYKNWDGSGGWGNFLGSAITDGIGAAFDPKTDAELRRQRQLQKMFGEYQLRSGLEATDMAKAKSSLEVQKIMADIQNMGVEAAWKKWKPLFDQQMGANKFTPEATAALTAAGFPVQDLDFRARELVERNGVPYSRAKTGPDDAVHVSGLPGDPTKYALPYNTPLTGTPIATTGDQIMDTEGRVLEANAGREQQAQITNANAVNAAARAHISDINAWMSQDGARRLALLEQAAKLPGLDGDLRMAVGEMQSALQRMQTVTQQMLPLPDGDARLPELQAALAEAEREYMTSMAKVEANQGKLVGAGNFVEQLRALPQKPMPNQAPVQTVKPVSTEENYRRGRGKKTYGLSDVERVLRQ